MVDILLCVAAGILLVIVIALIFFLKTTGSKTNNDPNEAQQVGQNLPVARPRNAGAPRARRRRMLAQPEPDDSEEEEEDNIVDVDLPSDGKVGAKKLRKLEEKAAKKAQREALEQDRKERKEREEKLEKQRKKEEARLEAEQAIKAAEEQKLKEEREKREHEEYLKLKEAFTVDEEGEQAEEEQDMQSLLKEFIDYIQQTKVVILEDLAAHFKIKTQDAIDRIKTLQEEGRLSGVIDDRGKFIYITQEEYDAVAKFIRQRGRVSIIELAESMNRVINLNPESRQIDTTMEEGVTVE